MIDRLLESRYLYLLIFIFYFIGLWGMSVPLTGDQKVYLSVALEMRERGSFIIPYLFGDANFLKPPLQYWATLLGWSIFGISLLGAMIPSVLALVASAWLVNKISLREFGNKSLLPGLLFSASIGTMTYGTTAQMEIWIVLFYLWAWFEFLEHRFFRALIVVGVMSWIKGPLYSVLWVLSTFFYLYQKRELKTVLSRRFLQSIVAGVVVGLAWYLLAARTHLQPMLDVFLLRENVAKMQTSQGTPAGLWAEFTYTLFPWLFFLLMALSMPALRKKIRQHQVFLLSFAIIPALFFTFFPYRVNTYLYLLTPVAAWICASGIEVVRSKITITFAIFSAVVAITLSFFAMRLLMGQWIGLELAIPLIVVLTVWTYSHFRFDLRGVALTSLLLVNFIRIGAVELGEKDLAGLRHFHATNSAPLAYFIEYKDIWHEFGLVSSALNSDIRRLYSLDEVSTFLAQGGAIILQDSQASAAEGLNCSEWFRLRKRLKFPMVQLLKEGLNYGDPSLIRSYLICQKTQI